MLSSNNSLTHAVHRCKNLSILFVIASFISWNRTANYPGFVYISAIAPRLSIICYFWSACNNRGAVPYQVQQVHCTVRPMHLKWTRCIMGRSTNPLQHVPCQHHIGESAHKQCIAFGMTPIMIRSLESCGSVPFFRNGCRFKSTKEHPKLLYAQAKSSECSYMAASCRGWPRHLSIPSEFRTSKVTPNLCHTLTS